MDPRAAAAAAALASPSDAADSIGASPQAPSLTLTSPSAGSTPSESAPPTLAVANLVPPPMQLHQPRSRQRVSPLPSAHAHAAELELQPMAPVPTALPALQLSPDQPSPSMQALSAFPSLPAHLYGQQAAADAAAAAAAASAAAASSSAAFSQPPQIQPQQQSLGSFVSPLAAYPAPPPPLLLPPHLRDLPPFQPQWQQHASAQLDTSDPYSFAGMHGTVPTLAANGGGRPYFNSAAATGFAPYPPQHAQMGMMGFDSNGGNPFGSASAASASAAASGGLAPGLRPPLEYNFSVVEENEGEDGYDDDDDDTDPDDDDDDDDDDEHDPTVGGGLHHGGGHEEEEDEDEATLAAEEQRIQAAADRFAQEQLAMQGCAGYLRSKCASLSPSFETQQRLWTWVWKSYRVVLFLGLIFLIFAHPLRRVLLPGSVAVESSFDALFFLCFLVFLLEALVLLKFHPLYRRELHLLAMDFLAIVSILPFVGFIWDPLVNSLPPPKDFSTQPSYDAEEAAATGSADQGAQGNYHEGSSAPGDSPTNEFHVFNLSSLALIMLCRTSFHVRIIRFIKVHVLLRGLTAFRVLRAERMRQREVEAKKRRWIAAGKAREAADRTNRKLTHEALQEANVAHARAGALRALVAEANRELGRDKSNQGSSGSKPQSRSIQPQQLQQPREQTSTPKVSSHPLVMPTVDSPMAAVASADSARHREHEQQQVEEQAMIAALCSTLASTTAADSLTESQTTPEHQNHTVSAADHPLQLDAEDADQRRTSIPDGLHYSIQPGGAEEVTPQHDEHKELPVAHEVPHSPDHTHDRDELPPLLLSALEQPQPQPPPPTLYPSVSPYLSPGFATLSPSHTTDASPSPYLRVHIGDDADSSASPERVSDVASWPVMHHEASTPYALSHLSSAHDPAAVNVRSPSFARSSSNRRSKSRPSGSTSKPVSRTPRKMTASQKHGDRADSDDDDDDLSAHAGGVAGVTITAISPMGAVEDWASERSRSSGAWSDAWAAGHDEHTGESDVGEDEMMDEVVDPFDPTDPYKSAAAQSAAPTAMPAIIGSFTSHQLSDFTTTVLIAITLLIVFVYHFVNRSPLDHASTPGLDQVSDLWIGMERQLWKLNAALDSSGGVYSPVVAGLYAAFVSTALRMDFHMRTMIEVDQQGVEVEHLSFQHSLLFRPHVMPRLNWRAMLPDATGQRDATRNLAFGPDLTRFNDALATNPFFLCLRPGVTTFEQSRQMILPLPGAPGMSGYFVLRQSPDLETQSRNERVWRWASQAQTIAPTGPGSFTPPPIGGVPAVLAGLDPVPVGIVYSNISDHTATHLLSNLYYLLFFLILSSIVLLLYDLKVQQILMPIERMMLFVERMIGDPLGVISMRDHDQDHDEDSIDHRKMDPEDEDEDDGGQPHRLNHSLGNGAARMDDDAAFDDPERRRKLLDASRALEAEELAVQTKRLHAGTMPAKTAPTSPNGYDDASSAGPREADVLLNPSVPLQTPLAPPRHAAAARTLSASGRSMMANMEERKESPHTGMIVLHGSPNSSPSIGPLRLPSSNARRHSMGTGPKGLGSRKPSDSSQSASKRKSNSTNRRRSSGSKAGVQDPAGVTDGTAPSSKRGSNSHRKSLESVRKTSPIIKPAAATSSTAVVTTKSLRPSAAATAAAAAAAAASAAAASQSTMPHPRHRSRNNETSTVEKGMQKLALLLQVGFGVAGSSIISNNLLHSGASAASINPRGARGTKMFGIFGFTDLRNIVDSYFESGDEVDAWPDAKDRRSTFLSPKRAAASSCAAAGSSSQIFLEQILVFINGLQALVHGETHRYGGFVNSSIGSNTLMAWKFDVPAFEKIEQQYPMEAFAHLKQQQQQQQAHYQMQQQQQEQQQQQMFATSMLAPPPPPHARTPSAGNTADNSAVPSVAPSVAPSVVPSPALTSQPAPGTSSSLQPPLRRVPSGQYAPSSRRQSLPPTTTGVTAPAPAPAAGATTVAAQSQQPPPFSPGLRPMLPRQRSLSIQFGAQPSVPASPLVAPQTPSKHLTQQRRASMSGFSPALATGTVPASPAPSAARSALANLGGSSMSAIPLSMSMRSASIGAAQRDQAATGGSSHPSRRGSINLGALSPDLVPSSPRNAPLSFALSPPHARSMSSLPTSPLRRSVTMGNTSLAASQQQQQQLSHVQSPHAHPRAVQLGLDRHPPRSPRARAVGRNLSPKPKTHKLATAGEGARFNFVVQASEPTGLVRSQSLAALPAPSSQAETPRLQNAAALPTQPLSGSLPPSTSNSQPGSTSISASNSSMNLAALAQSASFGEHALLVPSPGVSASATPAPLSPHSQPVPPSAAAVAAAAPVFPGDTLVPKRQQRHPFSTTAIDHAHHRSFTFETVRGEPSHAAPPRSGHPTHLVPSLLATNLRTSSAGAMNAPDAAPAESGSARIMSTLAPPHGTVRRSSLPSLSLPPPAPVNPSVSSSRSVALLSLAAAPSSSDFTLRPPLPRQGSLGSANSASSQVLPSASDSSSQSLAASLGSTAANSPRSMSRTVDALEDHRVRMLARLRTNSIPNIATAAVVVTRRARQHMHSQSTLPASVTRAPLLPDAEPTTPLLLYPPTSHPETAPDGSISPERSRSASQFSSGRESKLREEGVMAAAASAPSVVFHPENGDLENGCEVVSAPAAAAGDDPTGSPTSANDIVFHTTPTGSPASSPPRALKIDLGELEGVDAVARSHGGDDSSAAGAPSLPLDSWSSVAPTSEAPLAARSSAHPMIVKLNRLDLSSNTSSPQVRERVFVPATPITPPRYEPAVSQTEPNSPMMTNAEANALQRAAAARRNQSRKLPVFDHAAIQSAAEEKSADAATVPSSDPPLEPIDLDALVLSSRRSPAPPPHRPSGRSLVSNGLHVNTDAAGSRRASGSGHPPLHSFHSSPALRPYRQGSASPAVRGTASPAPPLPPQPPTSFSVSPAPDDDLQPDSANLDDLAEDPLSPHNDITRAFVRMTMHPLGQMQLRRTASGALLAFAKTLVKIATDISLSRWRQHKLLKPHLSGIGGMLVANPSSNSPDAPLKLVNRGPHMGLHIGWAIEGAIGSRHKIDATYLSPNVNLAARLAAATKQYYLPLLFSQSFLKLLPAILRARCRFVDKVLLKGSAKPMEIWTFDLFIEPEAPQPQAQRVNQTATTQPATVAASAVVSAAPSVAGTRRQTPSTSESTFPHLVVEINGVTPPHPTQTPMPLTAAASTAHTRQNSAQLIGGAWITRDRDDSHSGAAGNESKQDDVPPRSRTPTSGPPVLSRPASLVHQQQPATSSGSQPSSTLLPYPSPSPSPQPLMFPLLPPTAHGSSALPTSSSFLSLPDALSFEAHVGQSLESDMSKLNATRRSSLTGHARQDVGGPHHLRRKSSQVQMAQALQQQQQVEWALMASQQQHQQQQLAHQQQQLQQHWLQIQQQQQMQQWQQQQELASMYDGNGQAVHPMGLLSPSPAPPSAAPFDLSSLHHPQPTPSPPAPAFVFPPSLMAASIPHAHTHTQLPSSSSGAPDLRIPMPPTLPLPQLAPSLNADPVLQKILFVLLSLQAHTPHPLFTLTHNHATECYLRGEWLTAKQLYEQVLGWLPRDGPARVLLDFMAASQFQPPADWPGYRKLEKK